jgi:hypothetical protein
MKDRRIHIKKVEGFSIYNIDCTSIDDAFEGIKGCIEQFKKENKEYSWHDFKFDVDYDYEGDTTLYIEAYRYWTDEEIIEEEKRIKEREEEIQSQKEAHERKEYERLKRKFEK